jgi:hypothetical protein
LSLNVRDIEGEKLHPTTTLSPAATGLGNCNIVGFAAGLDPAAIALVGTCADTLIAVNNVTAAKNINPFMASP